MRMAFEMQMHLSPLRGPPRKSAPRIRTRETVEDHRAGAAANPWSKGRRLRPNPQTQTMDDIESTAKALRSALTKYASLEARGTARAAVAQSLFGVPASRRLLPMLDELAQSVQPVEKSHGD
jgi:hypothetical protein